MIKVFLREKKLKYGKRGLYLDFYPPIIHPESGQQTRREHLRLYIYEKPKGETEKDHNKETKLLAENIRAKRQLELQAGVYGFVSTRHRQKDFLEYFGKIVESKKQNSKGNLLIWRAAERHLKAFTGCKCRFADITEKFCLDFKTFLSDNTELAKSSASSYFDKFKNAVQQAYENNLLSSNPAKKIKPIKYTHGQREFLTYEELLILSKTPYHYDVMRRAALFSALTGLRFSDIYKLTWEEIQHSREQGDYIRFRQKKTGSAETLPISSETIELLGKRGKPTMRVFADLHDWHCNHIKNWVKAAGIDKKVTFHSFRHTFATLQITLGTDIFTVSKMLGHRDLKTTQIYAKIIDAKKREAANRISLK